MSLEGKRTTTYMRTHNANKGRNLQKGIESRSNTKSRDKSKLSCFYWKKEDHFKKDCKKRKIDFEKWHSNNNNQVGLAKDNNNNGNLLYVSDGVSGLTDSWVLDSNCSFHMNPNRHWFHGYKPLDSGFVLMENIISYKIEGINIIKIKIFDETVRILT